MKAIANAFMTYLAELVFVAGCAAITVGAGMIYLPAGLIAGGLLAAVGALISLYGSGNK